MDEKRKMLRIYYTSFVRNNKSEIPKIQIGEFLIVNETPKYFMIVYSYRGEECGSIEKLKKSDYFSSKIFTNYRQDLENVLSGYTYCFEKDKGETIVNLTNHIENELKRKENNIKILRENWNKRNE